MKNKTRQTPYNKKINGKASIRVIHTDEEWMIAKTVNEKISFGK